MNSEHLYFKDKLSRLLEMGPESKVTVPCAGIQTLNNKVIKRTGELETVLVWK